MPRTTLHIDATVLRDLKRRQRDEGKTLGQLTSELLAKALAEEAATDDAEPFAWTTAPMNARVDISDKDALHRTLDQR